ncbi:MAG: hypothetical protein IIT53_10495 [Fibrobacter sp.]|nr:hypothetical protein [Fibrobacter sp.]
MPVTTIYRPRRSQPGTYTRVTTNTTGTGRVISTSRSVVRRVPRGATVSSSG